MSRVGEERGLTLIELLIAVTLFSLLAAGFASLFASGIALEKRVAWSRDEMGPARTALDTIHRSLRNLSIGDVETFLGTPDTLAVGTTDLAWAEGRVSGFRRSGFVFTRDPATGTVVRLSAEGDPIPLASNVLDLRFSYGTWNVEEETWKWKPTWSGFPHPQVVRAEVIVPDRDGATRSWSRVIRLPVR